MILPLGGFGGFGFSPGIAPLSLSSPSLSTDAFSSLSLGASNFAMSNPAMSLIAQGYGTGRSSYSPFGVSGMYGSIGLGAPFLGGGLFVGPGPNFMDVGSLFKQLWDATFGPKQNTMPSGSVNASTPQMSAPAPDETDSAGKAGKSRKSGKADTTDKADDADGDAADDVKGAKAKGTVGGGDWRANAGKGFEGTGVRVSGTSEDGEKKVVGLEPEADFDPKTSRPKLASALRTLHKNGVQTAMIGKESVPVGKTVRAAAKTKEELLRVTKAAQEAVNASNAKPDDKDLAAKAQDAVNTYNSAKRKAGNTWVPNTSGVLKALQKLVKPPASKSVAEGDVGAALVEPVRKVTGATYAVPADNKSHRILVKVDKGAKTDEVAGQIVAALDAAEKSMKGKASGQQISVAFSGEKAEAEAAQKKFDELYKKHTNANLPPIISFAEVKKT